MEDVIFREYDIRGKVGTEFMLDQVYPLTQAIAFYIHESSTQEKHTPIHAPTIVVGMDGRTTSPAIKQEMCKALIDSGFNVIFVGVCTTPAFYFALNTLHADGKPVAGGLMITASHNGKEYNGIKVCLGTKSVWGSQIRIIRDLYKQKKCVTLDQLYLNEDQLMESQATGQKISYTITEHAIIPDYIAWLKNHFAHIKNIDMSMVIDCGNGAAGTVMPELIKEMGWSRVQLLYPEVDGSYPNHEADPTVEKNMQDVRQLLATTDAVVGFGLDGDADRMGAMTKQGFLVPGDQLLALFAQPIIEKNSDAGIVFDIKSSGGLRELITQWGGRAIVSPSGHAIIKDYMARNHALLGGELSCHFFFADRYFGYDDGVYALLRLVELLSSGDNSAELSPDTRITHKITHKTLDQLIQVFPTKYSSREFRIFCPDNQKESVVKKLHAAFSAQPDIKIITIDGVHASFPFGWGIVRCSNTQPALSIRFEADTASDLQRVKARFVRELKPLLPDLDLDMLLQDTIGG
jgi:phosphomannomutase/phosphoglucomutase